MAAQNGRRPAVRPASVRDVLAYLDSFEAGARARVRATLPESIQKTIDGCSIRRR